MPENDITAQLADGTQLVFPSGTDPTIIQQRVKQYISGGMPNFSDVTGGASSTAQNAVSDEDLTFERNQMGQSGKKSPLYNPSVPLLPFPPTRANPNAPPAQALDLSKLGEAVDPRNPENWPMLGQMLATGAVSVFQPEAGPLVYTALSSAGGVIGRTGQQLAAMSDEKKPIPSTSRLLAEQGLSAASGALNEAVPRFALGAVRLPLRAFAPKTAVVKGAEELSTLPGKFGADQTAHIAGESIADAAETGSRIAHARGGELFAPLADLPVDVGEVAKIASKLPKNLLPTELATKLEKYNQLISMGEDTARNMRTPELAAAKLEEFRAMANKEISGAMTLEQLKDLRTQVGQLTRSSHPLAATVNQGEMKQAYKQLSMVMEDAALQGGKADQLAEFNKFYKGSMDIFERGIGDKITKADRLDPQRILDQLTQKGGVKRVQQFKQMLSYAEEFGDDAAKAQATEAMQHFQRGLLDKVYKGSEDKGFGVILENIDKVGRDVMEEGIGKQETKNLMTLAKVVSDEHNAAQFMRDVTSTIAKWGFHVPLPVAWIRRFAEEAVAYGATSPILQASVNGLEKLGTKGGAEIPANLLRIIEAYAAVTLGPHSQPNALNTTRALSQAQPPQAPNFGFAALSPIPPLPNLTEQ